MIFFDPLHPKKSIYMAEYGFTDTNRTKIEAMHE